MHLRSSWIALLKRAERWEPFCRVEPRAAEMPEPMTFCLRSFSLF